MSCTQLLSSNTVEVTDGKNWIAASILLKQPFDFVYGGGGIWNPHYNYMKLLKMYAMHKNMRSFTILPSSFWQCDDAVRMFDSRFTVFCRDMQSYEYCTSRNKTAKFIMHDDVAFWLEGRLPVGMLTEDTIENGKLKTAYKTVQ